MNDGTPTVKTPFGEVSSNIKAWRLVEHYFEPLLPFYSDPAVTEIMVNRYDRIFVERSGKAMEKVEAAFASEEALVTAIEQLASTLGQNFSLKQPIFDGRFPDQSRANANLRGGCAPDGTNLTIRRAPKIHLSLTDLLKFEALSPEMAAYLKHAIYEAANMVISGGTSSGKTTVIRALTRFIPPMERVVSAEDTRELVLDWLPNSISLEAPKRRLEPGDDFIDLPRLVYTTLRMRPDRVIVGEIRDGGAADAFVQALGTGHAGCMTTIHANSARLSLRRLQYLIATKGAISFDLAGETLLGDLQVIVYAEKKTGVGKKIMEIVEIIDEEPVLVFKYDRKQRCHVPTEHLTRSRYWPVPDEIAALEGA